MSQSLCPNCDQMTAVSDSPKLGENVTCKHCGVESVIVWLNPIELDLPYIEGYDEDDLAYEDDRFYDDEDYRDYSFREIYRGGFGQSHT